MTFPEESDEPLNSFFEQSGFSSTFAVKNMGSTFIFLVIEVGLYIAYYLCKLIGYLY
jgi:hypothetical protein